MSVTRPPSLLREAFQQSGALRYSKSFPLPVYNGLCYATHVYTADDIEVVIDSAQSVIAPDHAMYLPLLSSSTGKPFPATTAKDLYLQVATELLTSTIFVDEITGDVVDRLKSFSGCQVEHFRGSLFLKGLLTGIETHVPASSTSRRDLVSWSSDFNSERQPRMTADAKLAIVGLSCRMPDGANTVDEFWHFIEQGRDAHTKVRADRFDLETHYDPTAETENATQTPFGNFIDRPGMFDAGFFRMSPLEVCSDGLAIAVF